MEKLRCLFVAGCLASLCGCGEMPPPGAAATLGRKVGRECTVQFRRDALGAGTTVPISPETSEINGASVVLRGTLRAVRGEWLELDVSIRYRDGAGGPERVLHRDIHIPTASVLYVEFDDGATQL